MNVPRRATASDLLERGAVPTWSFMLRMQVPAGQPLAGIWPSQDPPASAGRTCRTLPHQDPVKRVPARPVAPPATYDLAATAAQAARLEAETRSCLRGPMFGRRRVAYATARKTPFIRAEKEVQGGGAYGDGRHRRRSLLGRERIVRHERAIPATATSWSDSRFHKPDPGPGVGLFHGVGPRGPARQS
jgi:hypothetical protein